MPKTYDINQYLLLAGRLSKEELDCLSHCLVFNDCAIDGTCEIQNKAGKVLKGVT